MFVRTHTYVENQYDTKVTSALADSRIYSSWTVSFLVKTLFVLGFSRQVSQCFTFFSQHFDHVIIKNRFECFENHWYESLAFSQHNIDLVFDEETMKPERLVHLFSQWRL